LNELEEEVDSTIDDLAMYQAMMRYIRNAQHGTKRAKRRRAFP